MGIGRIGIGNFINIGKYRAWNMGVFIFGLRVALILGHMPGRIHDFDFRMMELISQPVCGNKCRHAA